MACETKILVFIWTVREQDAGMRASKRTVYMNTEVLISPASSYVMISKKGVQVYSANRRYSDVY